MVAGFKANWKRPNCTLQQGTEVHPVTHSGISPVSLVRQGRSERPARAAVELMTRRHRSRDALRAAIADPLRKEDTQWGRGVVPTGWGEIKMTSNLVDPNATSKWRAAGTVFSLS